VCAAGQLQCELPASNACCSHAKGSTNSHMCDMRLCAVTSGCCCYNYLGPKWCRPPLWYMCDPPAGGLIMPTPLPVPAVWLLLPAAPRVRISDTADSTQRCRRDSDSRAAGAGSKQQQWHHHMCSQCGMTIVDGRVCLWPLHRFARWLDTE
jgi:hypothetical protein